MRLLAPAMLPLRMLGILMLMIHFCGCEDSCSYNPVLLHPLEIVEEYGKEVSINCSSDYPHYQQIAIIVKNKTYYPEEPFRDYAIFSFPLDDWNIEPRCRVLVNESHECYKDVDMTVYKNPEVDLLVKKEDAVGVELQCDIFDVAPVQNLSVRWYKNDHLIRINSFSGKSREAVNESSVLTVSKEENTTQFRCEAHLNLRSRSLPATISKTLNISATKIPVSRDVTPAHEILTSETETTPPPQFDMLSTTFHPFNMPDSENFTVINSSTAEDDESTTSENILYVAETTKAHPAEVITCESLKKAFKITPPEVVVRYGDPVVLTCSGDNASVELVSWETPYGRHEEMNHFTSNLTITKVETWKLELMCFAAFFAGQQCTLEPNITVYKTPDSVSVTAVDPGPMIEGKKYLLSCNILNVAPVNQLHVKWYRGNESLHTEHPKNDHLSTPQNVSSILTVPLERGDNGSTFRCEAELQLGPELSPLTLSAPYTALVHYKPFFKSCPVRHTVEENKFRMSQLVCETDGNPPPSVEWYHAGQKLTDLDKLFTRTDSGVYRASVSNSVGQSSTDVLITVEYAPSFSCNRHYKAKVNSELKTPCEPEGSPPPTITWLKNGAEVISTRRWTKNDGGNYTLRATNTHGTALHMLYLDILCMFILSQNYSCAKNICIYIQWAKLNIKFSIHRSPEFNQGNTSEEIILGQNMTLDCSADGNPKPEIHWNYTSAENLRVTTVGRHKIIMTITRATSTNAGKYICVASNKLGMKTRFVSLTEMGKGNDKSISGFLWWIILLVILIFVVLGVVFLFYKKRKYRIYNVVGNKDPQQIPMTNKSVAANS
ncbi:hypothetical protein OJAV_G00080240 [Oryzias javanicus]|uniref:Ig-like domain-containing protein n=1 Tax=Oryzias javanicus TaxID=123683 RepID=A0A3S2MYH6_ORYJA|nr:hypothetical protein OJAV_G00080240 [Oryzias javanicus]